MSRTVTVSVPMSSDCQAAPSASTPMLSGSSCSRRSRVTPSLPSTSRPRSTDVGVLGSTCSWPSDELPTGSGYPEASVARNSPPRSRTLAPPLRPSVSRLTVYSTPWNSNVSAASAPAATAVTPVTAVVSAYP